MIFLKLIIVSEDRNNSVGITIKELGFDSRQGQEIFLFFTEPRPALGCTPPHIQWVPGALSPAGKAAEA